MTLTFKGTADQAIKALAYQRGLKPVDTAGMTAMMLDLVQEKLDDNAALINAARKTPSGFGQSEGVGA